VLAPPYEIQIIGTERNGTKKDEKAGEEEEEVKANPVFFFYSNVTFFCRHLRGLSWLVLTP
jgi:hypothetical protein